MEARVKQDARYKVYQLFSGREFIKSEWRNVPAGFEDAARNESLLEVREPDAKAPEQPKAFSGFVETPPAEVKKTPGKKAIKAAE